MDNEDYDYLFKIVMVGDSEVGKSNLVSMFTQNKFTQDFESTVGVEFSTRTIRVDDKDFKAQIWDATGQESYREITSAYYRGATGALLVYDVTRPVTFENLEIWQEEIRGNTDAKIVILLVGNKADSQHPRAVSTADGKSFAERENMLFMETSALESLNVENAFNEVMSTAYRVFIAKGG